MKLSHEVSRAMVLFLLLYSLAAAGDDKRAQAPPAKGHLRVASWNVWYLRKRPASGLKLLAKHIESFTPDVLALQEVISPQQAEGIAGELGVNWRVFSSEESHNAVLYNSKRVTLVKAEHWQTLEGEKWPGRGKRVPVSLVFHPVGNKPQLIHVLGFHLNYKTATMRKAQVDWIIRRQTQFASAHPKLKHQIFLGDYNAPATESIHRSIEDGLDLTLLPKANGDVTCGHPKFGNAEAIDHVSVSRGLLTKGLATYVVRPAVPIVDFEAYKKQYSDHFAIYCDLDL